MRKIFKIIYLSILILVGTFQVNAAEKVEFLKTDWSFKGLFGKFDRGSLQRGYQVYSEVCAGCHSMKYLSYRNLSEKGGPEFSIEQAKAIGVELVSIEAWLRESDFVCICCALTPETHYLINAERLDLMKETAYLINTSRGPIVEEQALINALRNQRIQGAGLDVFEQEPIDINNPLLNMENVILTPHAICWTDECFLGNGQSACQSIVDVSMGRLPQNIVNREVVDHPRLKEKLSEFSN